MKPQTLPIKRKPVPKGILHKLSAVTRSRKQRVAAAAPVGDMEVDDGSSKISRALTIIFLIHIVAVGLIFVHKHFLDGRMPAATVTTTQDVPAPAPVVAAPAAIRETLPRLSSGDKVYVVKPGDNYTRIAGREGVEESVLREINENVEIRPGLILSVPPRRIVAQEPAEVARIRESQQTTLVEPAVNEEDGLVGAIDIAGAPRAVTVKSETTVATIIPATVTTSGRSHTVKSGDNIWRISQKYKVKQQDLIKLNNITDSSKVRIGIKLVIPD